MADSTLEDLVVPEPKLDPFEGIRRGYLVFLMLAAAAGLSTLRPAALETEPEMPTVVKEETSQPPPKPAAPPTQDGTPARIYRPILVDHYRDPHGSMWHFFQALLDETQGTRKEPIRALYYGNSEIGFDRPTSQIRRRLQSHFGDGGKGFLVAAPGWRYQRHSDVVWKQGGQWKIDTIRGGKRKDGLYGLGGVLAISDGPAWTEFAAVPVKDSRPEGYRNFPTGTRFSKFELYYQTYAGGGKIDIAVDGQATESLTGASYTPKDRVHSLDLEDGPHSVRISGGKRPIRLYGAVLERERGFVLDTVQVIGAWANSQSVFNKDHLKRQVARRKPDLVIFQWGAKELMRNPTMSPVQFRTFKKSYAEGVRRTMAARPRASCLIVSTKDMGMRHRNLIVTRPAVKSIVRGASDVADETGCAFINLFEALGGENTMRRWYEETPKRVAPDLGHLMRLGAIEVGDTISDILLKAYDQYEKERREPAS